RPGGNVTGLMTATSALEAKKFGLLCEMVPNARLVAMLINPDYPPNATDAVEVQSAAQSIGRQLLLVRANSAGTIDLAIAAIVAQRAEALLVAGDPFLESRNQQLVTLTTRHAIPAMFNFREGVQRGGLMSYGANISNNYRQLGAAGRILKGESPADLPVMYPAVFDFAINLVTAKAFLYRPYVDAGGLMSYGVDFPVMYRRTADYVAKIFKGAKPDDLPVEQATKFEMVVNLKTAKAIGVELPTAILLRADEVIE